MSAPTLTGANANRTKGHVFRERVTHYLAARLGLGLTFRALRGPGLKLSDQYIPVSDIHGVPGWSLITRNEYRVDLSGAADSAARAALDDGRAYGAAVCFRGGRDIEDAFVVMPLSMLAAVINAQQADRI